MHEFESFVYLDMEKTGSAFISTLLRRYCVERALRRDHHAPMEGEVDRAKFYFISVREPLDAYLSLYSYGCDNKGKLQNRLGRKEDKLHGQFYDGTSKGFCAWLDFMLSPESAKFIGEGYDEAGGGELCKRIGLQTFRYLKLALPNAMELLAPCRKQTHVYTVHARNKLPGFVVRHDNFVDDLCRLVAGPLAHAFPDREGTLRFVRTELPVNASDRVDATGDRFRIRPRLVERVREREWLLYDLFKY
jgi:hypothetical protein